MVGTKAQQSQIISEFHESNWAGHTGTWATFNQIKQKYWWKGMYKDVAQYIEMRKVSMYSAVRHRDKLHPTFSPTMNFKWMVDIITIPTGAGQQKYLVLA
jgi:hypothetical protein